MLWLSSFIADFFTPWLKQIVNTAIKFTTTFWGVVLIVAGCVWFVLNDTVGAIQQIAGLLGGLSVGHGSLAPSGSSALWLLAVCNTFAPMDELFSYSATYFVLVGTFGLYRLIKSWIPGGFAGGS